MWTSGAGSRGRDRTGNDSGRSGSHGGKGNNTRSGAGSHGGIGNSCDRRYARGRRRLHNSGLTGSAIDGPPVGIAFEAKQFGAEGVELPAPSSE